MSAKVLVKMLLKEVFGYANIKPLTVEQIDTATDWITNIYSKSNFSCLEGSLNAEELHDRVKSELTSEAADLVGLTVELENGQYITFTHHDGRSLSTDNLSYNCVTIGLSEGFDGRSTLPETHNNLKEEFDRHKVTLSSLGAVSVKTFYKNDISLPFASSDILSALDDQQHKEINSQRLSR